MRKDLTTIDISEIPLDYSDILFDTNKIRYKFIWEELEVTPIQITFDSKPLPIGVLCSIQKNKLVQLHLIRFSDSNSIEIIERDPIDLPEYCITLAQYIIENYSDNKNPFNIYDACNTVANKYLTVPRERADYLTSNIQDRYIFLASKLKDLNTKTNTLPQNIKEHLEPLIARLNKPSIPHTEKQAIEDYIHVISSIKFNSLKEAKIDNLHSALEKSHASLAEVKSVLCNIAFIYKTKTYFNPCLTLVGNPGVGKTSLIRTIGNELGLSVASIPLAGVRDTSYLLGFPRSYSKSAPGKIIDALITSKSMNPIIIFDEIDKASYEVQNCLLHILDPNNKDLFVDQYIGTSIDLSKVLFFATANDQNAIFEPLLDRLLVLNIPQYTAEQKNIIIKDYLLPKIEKDLNLEINLSEAFLYNLLTKKSIRDIEKIIYLNILSYPISNQSSVYLDSFKRNIKSLGF